MQATPQTIDLPEDAQLSQTVSFDLGDILLGEKRLQDLPQEQIYAYLKNHYQPGENDHILQKEVNRGGKKVLLTFQRSWIKDNPWLVYSKKVEGGLCKVCILFDPPSKRKQRGNFVNKPFKNIKRSEKIKEHFETDYHEDAELKETLFLNSYVNPLRRVDVNPFHQVRYEENVNILELIIESVLVCAEQGLPLRGHRDHSADDHIEDDSNNINVNKGNFLAILNSHAKYQPTLKRHLEKESGKTKMISWYAQNEIIQCIAKFVRNRITNDISEEKYFAIIADEVTDNHANKEILLLCLRYVYFENKQPKIVETFFDSIHLKGRPTGKNIGNNILTLLSKHDIDVRNCRAQAYDGAAAMGSARKGASAIVREQQSKAEYTHCRSHIINLAIIHACKNDYIKKMVAIVTQMSLFYDLSPKRKNYFESFINFYADEVGNTDRTKLINLSRTRWVERHRAYETYYMLFKINLGILESMFDSEKYSEFYDHLEKEFDEKWEFDSETRVKASGLFKQGKDFRHIISLIIAINALEPIKPLVKKLQKRNADIFKGYHMIDSVIEELGKFRENIDVVFDKWYKEAAEFAAEVNVRPEMPPTAKCWKTTNSNDKEGDSKEYFKCSIAIPFLDDITNQLIERLKDRNHIELFRILPSLMLTETFNIDDTENILRNKFGDDLPDHGAQLKSELKRWKLMWQQDMEIKKKNHETEKKTQHIKKVRAGKTSSHDKPTTAFNLEDPPDGFLEALVYGDIDIFPNIRVLLILGAVSPLGSCEAERSASGVGRLKTAYRSTMADTREADLNLIQLQKVVKVDVQEVIRMFIDMHPRQMFSKSILFDD